MSKAERGGKARARRGRDARYERTSVAVPLSFERRSHLAEYLRCEIARAARREMIVMLDDFLRRRSKIALVISRDELRAAPGLREACDLLFGSEAEARIAECFAA